MGNIILSWDNSHVNYFKQHFEYSEHYNPSILKCWPLFLLFQTKLLSAEECKGREHQCISFFHPSLSVFASCCQANICKYTPKCTINPCAALVHLLQSVFGLFHLTQPLYRLGCVSVFATGVSFVRKVVCKWVKQQFCLEGESTERRHYSEDMVKTEAATKCY